MEKLALSPIGTIHTPFKDIAGMPIQPAGAASVDGQVVVDPRYAPGLEDIDGFSHLILIYRFHLSSGFDLTVEPFLDHRPRGLFATRAPRRPNPLGISVVSLVRRQDNVLHVRRIDVVDGTPLIDIKPFVPAFDAPPASSIGWLEGKVTGGRSVQSDRRFEGRHRER